MGLIGSCVPPTHWKLEFTDGQPKTVFCSVSNCCPAMRSCDGSEIKSQPVSTNGASVTGPTIGIRYSRLVTMLVSPPGKMICDTGIWMLYAPWRGLAGFRGTIEPSGFC